MWFLWAEATFCRANIMASVTRFDNVLTKLPQSDISSIQDVVRPASSLGDPCVWVQARLTGKFGKTRWHRISASWTILTSGIAGHP
jgi:hypothetical protein